MVTMSAQQQRPKRKLSRWPSETHAVDRDSADGGIRRSAERTPDGDRLRVNIGPRPTQAKCPLSTLSGPAAIDPLRTFRCDVRGPLLNGADAALHIHQQLPGRASRGAGPLQQLQGLRLRRFEPDTRR